MSCMVYIVRHGIAGDADAQTTDFDRALTAEGTHKMTRAAKGLRRMGIVPDVILSSPLRRAEETATLVGGIIAPDCAVEVFKPLASGGTPEEVLRGLVQYRRARRIMLVGHQPDLGELASYLLTGSAGLAPLPFKKGAVAAIEVGSIPPRSSGLLQWFLTSRQLRAIGSRSRRAANSSR